MYKINPFDHPIEMWITAEKCPLEILGSVMNVLGKYSLKKYKQHPSYNKADTSMTRCLRKIGDCIRNKNPKNEDILRRFSQSTPEEMESAKTWMAEQFINDHPRLCDEWEANAFLADLLETKSEIT